MKCPACNETLIVLEYEEVEVDYCPSCEGTWLDAGEIEILFGDAQACRAFLSIGSPADAKGEKPRRCPICDKKMSKEATSGAEPVLFDTCPAGDGFWFDKGELGTVLQHGEAAGIHTQVADFLRDVFKAES